EHDIAAHPDPARGQPARRGIRLGAARARSWNWRWADGPPGVRAGQRHAEGGQFRVGRIPVPAVALAVGTDRDPGPRRDPGLSRYEAGRSAESMPAGPRRPRDPLTLRWCPGSGP